MAARGSADDEYVRRTDVRDDVGTLVAVFADLGTEAMVVDQTRPDVGMPVVKAVVPGLRSFRARVAPGRLVDVPVALGRLPRPTAYAELNPPPLYM